MAAREDTRGLGRWIAPPRFLMFLAALVLGFLGWRTWMRPGAWADPAAMGFDLAAVVFLVSLVPILRAGDAASIRRHAAQNDAGRGLVLLLTTVVSMVVMAAIAGELPAAGGGDVLAMGKLVGTLVLAWVFANTVYALHYAHLYYSSKPKHGGDCGGLDFPGTKEPDYLDFVYFSFTLGMTFQTSDVGITAGAIRRVVTLQSLAAFVFNIGVIAFTINALGGSGG